MPDETFRPIIGDQAVGTERRHVIEVSSLVAMLLFFLAAYLLVMLISLIGWTGDEWQSGAQEGQLGRTRALFCTLDGSPLDPSYVRKLLARLAGKAGIEKRVNPRALRHSHAAELGAEGVPVNVIQGQLGHANLAVTDRYLRHVLPVDQVAAMQQRTWEP